MKYFTLKYSFLFGLFTDFSITQIIIIGSYDNLINEWLIEKGEELGYYPIWGTMLVSA